MEILSCRGCGAQNSSGFLNCDACRERDRERVARYRETEKFRESNARWLESPNGRASRRATRDRHYGKPEVQARLRAKRTSVEGRAYARLQTQAYRARLRGATVLKVPADGLRGKLAMYGWRCWICRVAPFEHWDHVKPLNRGGPHVLANLRPACATCNKSKQDTWPFHTGRRRRGGSP